jgi:hypothetical protein
MILAQHCTDDCKSSMYGHLYNQYYGKFNVFGGQTSIISVLLKRPGCRKIFKEKQSTASGLFR